MGMKILSTGRGDYAYFEIQLGTRMDDGVLEVYVINHIVYLNTHRGLELADEDLSEFVLDYVY